MTTEEKEAARNVADSYWWWVQQKLYGRQVLSDNPMYTREFVLEHSWAFYGYEQTRIELHQEMCELLGLTEEETRPVTDNMDECEDFDDFFERLLKIKAEKENHGQPTEPADA